MDIPLLFPLWGGDRPGSVIPISGCRCGIGKAETLGEEQGIRRSAGECEGREPHPLGAQFPASYPSFSPHPSLLICASVTSCDGASSLSHSVCPSFSCDMIQTKICLSPTCPPVPYCGSRVFLVHSWLTQCPKTVPYLLIRLFQYTEFKMVY